MSITAAIASAYDLLAQRWSDAEFKSGDGVPHLRRALTFLEPDRAGWALNVGCGCNTRFNASIKAHGLQIEGIDVSPRMVALGRAADPDVAVHLADIRSWELPRRYAFILGWDSLWHVPLGDQEPVLRKLMSALEPGGVFQFSAGGLEAPGEHTDSAMGPAVYYATPGIPALLEIINHASCICRHLEFDQYPQTHLCVIVQRID